MTNKRIRGLLLISGGIDSPVAGYLMARKNVQIDAIHFLNYTSLEKIKQLLNILKRYTINKVIKLYVVDHVSVLNEIKLKAFDNMRCILCKSFMLHFSDRLAKEKDYDLLINGDNLGQVASQTLSNISTISHDTNTYIARPLLSFDKQEIINIAKEIGTYEISIKDNCGCKFLPKKPKTTSQREKLIEQEERVDFNNLIEREMRKIKEYDI